MNRVKKRYLALAIGVLVPCSVGFASLWLRLRDGHGDGLDQLASSMSLKSGDTRRFEWTSQEKRHWQIVTTDKLETPAQTDAREKTRGACRAGMVEVKGEFLLDSYGTELSDEVESLQSKSCSTWLNKDFPARCADFDPAAWKTAQAPLKKKEMHYCIDRFEYPNRRGGYPWIVATYTESQQICKREGKRLCTESEWTFACEGEEATPYPGGYEREAAACVADRDWREFDPAALGVRDSSRAEGEVDRLWQGEASGSRATCRSNFGVYDMTGNVDEWTSSVRKSGYRSVLKGGYWGPVRARCRPATRAHDEHFVAYQQGFRCCAAAPGENDPPEPEEEPLEEASTDGGSAAPSTLADAGGLDSGLSQGTDGGFSLQNPLPFAPDYGLLDEDEALGQKVRGVARGCSGGPTPK